MSKCAVVSDQVSHGYRMNHFEIWNWKSAGRRALRAFHPNQGLTLGRDDWSKTAILLGSRGGEGVLRCGWQCLSMALHPHDIVSSTSGEGWVFSVSLSLNEQKGWATLQKRLGAQVEACKNLTILLSQGDPRIVSRVVLQTKLHWHSKSIIYICGWVGTFFGDVLQNFKLFK